MKQKTLTICMSLLILVAFSATAQKEGSPFKGSITYNVSYPESSMSEAQTASMPQVIKILMNGSKTRAEVNMNGMNQVLLTDSEAKTTTVLLDMMGKKIALKPKSGDRPLGREPIVELANESKEIAGYMCKKANIHFGDENSKANPIEVYYTEAIGNNKLFYDNEYRNLPGIPLEFKYKLQGASMLLTATSIDKGKVSNRDFEVPSDYVESTPEQLRQMFGGGM